MKKYMASSTHLQTHFPELFGNTWGEIPYSTAWEYNNSEALRVLAEAFFKDAKQKAAQVFFHDDGWCDIARLRSGKRIAVGSNETLTGSGDFFIVELD